MRIIGQQFCLALARPAKGVDHAGAGHRQAGLRATGEVAGGVRGVAGRLLVAHADVGDAGLLRFGGNALHRKADDAEHVVDALLLETARHQLCAVDSSHGSSPLESVGDIETA